VTDPAPSTARLADAFAATAEPAAYIPRLALEAALAELGEVIGKTPACAALSGEAGLGKTLLLKVLRERLLGAFECLYVPFPRVSADELWRWAAVALGLGSGDDDRGAVLGRARRLRDEGSGLLLLVDDAGALPPATRAELLAALETTGFSVVLAFSSEDHAQLGSLPPFVRRVELGPPMTLSETRAYVHARLRRVDPDGAFAARLTVERLAALHEASGGVPARLHALLDAWLHAVAADAPSAPTERAGSSVPVPVMTAMPKLPPLPEGLRIWAQRLERPEVRLSLIALVVMATLGAWLFAWQKGPGVASVGVPVERLEVPSAQPAQLAPVPVEDSSDVAAEPPPETADPVEVAPPAPEVVPPVDAAPPPEAEPTSTGPTAPEAVAARGRARSLAPPLPPAPPLPDPNRPELPEDVSTARFPDEHVPALLEPEALAAPPAGPRLSVNARPWAAISLDGTPVGETPLGELRVTPGPHVVSAKLPDGRVVERSVEARAGDVYLVFP
jgi:hypothetical protein